MYKIKNIEVDQECKKIAIIAFKDQNLANKKAENLLKNQVFWVQLAIKERINFLYNDMKKHIEKINSLLKSEDIEVSDRDNVIKSLNKTTLPKRNIEIYLKCIFNY